MSVPLSFGRGPNGLAPSSGMNEFGTLDPRTRSYQPARYIPRRKSQGKCKGPDMEHCCYSWRRVVQILGGNPATGGRRLEDCERSGGQSRVVSVSGKKIRTDVAFASTIESIKQSIHVV